MASMMMRCASRRLRGRMLNRKDFSGISEQLMECEGPVTASCEGAWPGAACAWQHGKGFATAASPDEKPPILAHAIGEFSKFDPEKQSARYVPEGEEARGLMAQLQELAGRDERFDSVARVVADTMTEFHDWSGLPYWSVIVATSLATRFCLLPLLSMSMRSASVNVAIWRTASAIAPSRGVSRWALFQAARQRAGAPSLLWPFANAIAVISVLGQLSRVVRKMAVVGWPGFHLEGPQVLEGKLQSLVTPPANMFPYRPDLFGETLLPMGVEGALLPVSTAVLSAFLAQRAATSLQRTFFPVKEDGTPQNVQELDVRKLRAMSIYERAGVAAPMAAGIFAIAMQLVPLPLLATVLLSPQAVTFAIGPSLVMTTLVSEARNIPSVQRMVMGKFYKELTDPTRSVRLTDAPEASTQAFSGTPSELVEAVAPGWREAAARGQDAESILGATKALLARVPSASLEQRSELLSAVGKLLGRMEVVDPHSVGASMHRAKAAQLTGDMKTAQTILESLLEREDLSESRRHWALWTLGVVMAQGTEASSREAVKFLEQALALRPGDVRTMMALATTLVKLGERSRAQELVEKAKEVDASGEMRNIDWKAIGLQY